MLIQKMDVESEFRQAGVDPAGAVNFGYFLGGYLFVDHRMQFGWRGSPGRWGVIHHSEGCCDPTWTRKKRRYHCQPGLSGRRRSLWRSGPRGGARRRYGRFS